MIPNKTIDRIMRFLIVPSLLLLLAPRVQAAEPIPLRAGPLTMVFEPDNAFLRYVNLGPHEVLRGINAPIRNQFWGTVLPEVTNVVLKNHGDHFSLEFDAICHEEKIDFQWHGTIRGSAKGELELIFDGEAHSAWPLCRGSTLGRRKSERRKKQRGFSNFHFSPSAGQRYSLDFS